MAGMSAWLMRERCLAYTPYATYAPCVLYATCRQQLRSEPHVPGPALPAWVRSVTMLTSSCCRVPVRRLAVVPGTRPATRRFLELYSWRYSNLEERIVAVTSVDLDPQLIERA